jgi:hypothetical protein
MNITLKRTTGREIWRKLASQGLMPDAFVAGVWRNGDGSRQLFKYDIKPDKNHEKAIRNNITMQPVLHHEK